MQTEFADFVKRFPQSFSRFVFTDIRMSIFHDLGHAQHTFKMACNLILWSLIIFIEYLCAFVLNLVRSHFLTSLRPIAISFRFTTPFLSRSSLLPISSSVVSRTSWLFWRYKTASEMCLLHRPCFGATTTKYAPLPFAKHSTITGNIFQHE